MVEVILVTVPVAEVRVEASVRRSVLLFVEPQVPFADGVSGIPVTSQVLRHERLRQRKASRFGTQDDQMLHTLEKKRSFANERAGKSKLTHRRRVLPGQQRRSTRCAQRGDVMGVEDNAVVRESIYVRRRYLVASVETDIVPALQEPRSIPPSLSNALNLLGR